MAAPPGVTVVIPTVGRRSLAATLNGLAASWSAVADADLRAEVVVVDDRLHPTTPLALPIPAPLAAEPAGSRRSRSSGRSGSAPHVRTVAGPGRGPAAARNLGWRLARHEWVAFLDDDVVPEPTWFEDLAADLAAAEAGPRVGGVQGRISVPLPADRAPTDWERTTAGLARGRWITADMAYRRAALDAVGGFDERFARAYREDAELAHRVRAAGWDLVRGTRSSAHPVRAEGPWVSLRTQRGNADDALLRRLYGRRWRSLLDVPPGRRQRHAAVTAAGLAALGCAAVSLVASSPRAARQGPRGGFNRRRVWRIAAAVTAATWLAGTAEFAAARIAPGPRNPREVATMTATSAAIPPVAVTHWLVGWWRSRGVRPLSGAATSSAVRSAALIPILGVLFDLVPRR